MLAFWRLSSEKSILCFSVPMRAPQALAKKVSVFFVMFFLKMLYIKTYQANVLVLSLHVGKYREKRIFCWLKAQMMFVNENPLHVLGSHENIILEGTALEKAQK